MVYRDQIESSAQKRANAGMEALKILGEAVADDSITVQELAGLVGKIGACIGGLHGMLEAIALQYYPERPELKPPSIPLENLASTVADVYKISLADLLGPRRVANLVRARHVFFYLARLQGNASLKDIGGYAGGRDHTTVLSGADSIEHALEHEKDLPMILHTIRARLENNPRIGEKEG